MVPTWLRSALLRGLSASPDERWPTLEQLLDEIERRLSRDPELDLAIVRRRRSLIMVATCVLALGLIILVWSRAGVRLSTPAGALAIMGVWVVVHGATLLAANRSLRQHPENRRIAAVIGVGVMALLVHRTLGVPMAKPLRYILTGDLVALAAIMAFRAW